ncbi:MAG: DNA polymerase IV [Verrucomicrobiota bacterium]|nr:DNA polymerase IV [Verrucomicrobiota bacterium]
MRVVLHIDMDAFFAAVEQRDHPQFRGKPVIVGSPPHQRGVVCAASYEARKFGVRSAMPSFTAGRLCPKGIFVRPRIDVYREESHWIMEILASIGGPMEKMSIDEAYLDLSQIVQGTEHERRLYDAVPIARELKRKIYESRKLTATVGIASNKFLSKLASDFQKPNGLTLVPERDKVQFLRPLPVRAIHGVGKVTEKVLNSAGLFTIGDIQDFTGNLRALAGSWADSLRQYAFGNDDRPVEPGETIKSISSEETFDRDTEDRARLRSCLKQQAEELAEKLKRKRIAATTVQVKLRYSDFTTLTRQISLEEPISEQKEIYRLGCHLLGRERLVNRPLRLLGLGVSGLRDAVGTEQLKLPF